MSFSDARSILSTVSDDFAETVVYTNSLGTATSVLAGIGKKVFKVYDGDAPVSITCRRFLIKTTAISSWPANGETITWRGRRYKLGCPDGGAPWRFHTNDCTVLAVYANDFGEVDAE